jgi:catechol 2,3-dioxygenase-like lactoylglutathione lyase family enzyme
MSTHQVPGNDATGSASVASVDMKLEVVVIPVSDVDRAKEFYERIGWRLNVDRSAGEDFRLVQFTPPGSWCSVHFGKNLTPAAPGTARGFLIVPDIEAARDQLVAAGVEVSEFFHDGPEGRGSGLHPDRRTYRSRALFSDPLGKRPGERASACSRRSRQEREAHRRGRSELARPVRRVHGARTRRPGAAAINYFIVAIISLPESPKTATV